MSPFAIDLRIRSRHSALALQIRYGTSKPQLSQVVAHCDGAASPRQRTGDGPALPRARLPAIMAGPVLRSGPGKETR